MPVDMLLDRLEKVKHNGNNKWVACCPAHQDRSPSLSIWEPEPDKILIHCFAGCDIGDVLAAVDMSVSDLFPKRDQLSTHRDSPSYWSRMQREQQRQRDVNDATLAIYEQDIRRGKRFTPEENEKYKNLKLAQMRG